MDIGLVNLNILTLLPPGTTVIPNFFGREMTNLGRLDLSPCPIERIGYDCFKYACSLQELILPERLVKIGSGSFRELTSLVMLDLSPCQMLRVLDHDTFVGACSLRQLILPEGLVEIRSGALRGLTSLENLTIPASVMTISSGAFSGCSHLKQVILKGHPEIDANAFKRCHPSLTFVHQSSSKVEGCRLQLGQAAGGGVMGVVGGEPSLHSNSIFRFPCCIGKYDALKEKLKFGQADKDFECQITYEKFDTNIEIVILPCGHAFSVNGMLQWYKTQKSCPSCNKELQ